MHKIGLKKVRARLVASAAMVALSAGAAFAQATPASGQVPAADADNAEVPEIVVVTGTHLVTNGNEMPTPVTVVPVEELQNIQPSTLADNLNYLPVFSGSRGPTAKASNGANSAVNSLNLRNLGPNRDLILFDGHRLAPTVYDGTVDTDMIPQFMIQRVDIVTGGTSAVYGSDAISGVVNFVINRDLNGLKVQAQGGISGYGDDAQQDVGAAYGTELFGGRGHIEGSYEFRNDAGIPRRSERPWDNDWSVVGAGTAADPYFLASNVHYSTFSAGGLINTGVLSGQNFTTNGVLTPFQNGTAVPGSPAVQIGGGGSDDDTSLKASLKSQQTFLRADYDLNDGIHAYLDFSGAIKTTVQQQLPVLLSALTFSASNAFLPATAQAQLAAANQTTFKLSEEMTYNMPRNASGATLSSYFINGGLEGKIGKYNWDIYTAHSVSQEETATYNNVNTQNLYAALDAVVNPANGQIVCNVTLTNPTADPGCVPLDVFGPTSASSAATNYVQANKTTSTVLTAMNNAEVSIAGSPLDLWAGPINAALTGEWRQLSYSVVDTTAQAKSTSAAQLDNCTGLRFNCTAASTLYQYAGGSVSPVGESVWEIAAEGEAPLIKNAPLVELFSLNAAARYTAYSVTGEYSTWKLGADWQVTDSLRLRGTTSRDIRAPTLYELYGPTTVATNAFQDYLTNTTPTVPTYTGSNPNLTAEIGRTTTLGAVWTPMTGLSLTLDRYQIEILNALTTINGSNVAYQEACYASGGTGPTCALQARPLGFTNTSPANAVTAWYVSPANISRAYTNGYDAEVDYATQLADRPFTARLLANYQPVLQYYDEIAGTTIYDAGIASQTGARSAAPKYSATALIHYQPMDVFSVDLSERWRSQLTMQAAPSQVWINPLVPSFYTTNVTLTYTVTPEIGPLDFFLNVQNLFDKSPPPVAFYASQTPGEYGWAIGDDPVGRYFTLGIRGAF